MLSIVHNRFCSSLHISSIGQKSIENDSNNSRPFMLTTDSEKEDIYWIRMRSKEYWHSSWKCEFQNILPNLALRTGVSRWSDLYCVAWQWNCRMKTWLYIKFKVLVISIFILAFLLIWFSVSICYCRKLTFQ